ncbi:MAG: hypothetical protein L0H24_09720, partial [Microlunatus sp.]|nr:hypothetical protein [Microlunatus sp.]
TIGAEAAGVAAMAATTPGRWHKLDEVGEVRPGRRADLCVVNDRGRLQRVMQSGSWVASRATEG